MVDGVGNLGWDGKTRFSVKSAHENHEITLLEQLNIWISEVDLVDQRGLEPLTF